MANVKVPQLYGQVIAELDAVLTQLHAQALLTDEVLDPALLSNLYVQCTFTQNMFLSEFYAQVLVDPHPYPWMTEEVYSATYCWRIDRTDGISFGFTSHDQDLTFAGMPQLTREFLL